ncbi:hypothetical protein [Lactococcus lactis]|uniref:Lipoprotein n=1 Tax=Lactococcus lactis subsp. lactis TaxID=1360 RepID=A0A2N5WG27_LACLL|nr:hypothetical protein [Lactococcus lactis]PLW61194.1 hypothetical protein CYU10_002269 [Lactococcus lactis subsp. lactis]
MKRTFGTAAVLLLGIGLLASFGAKKESQGKVKVSNSKVSSSISKTSNSNFTKELIKTSQLTQSSSSIPISSTSPSSISTTTYHSTAPSSSSESASNVSTVPYGVSLVSENFPLTFYYKGFNVPESVTINDASIASVTILSQNGKSTTYKTSVTTIPTKQIRIFSAGIHTNQIRPVKVNTQINLLQNQPSSYTFEGPMYLFYNNQGGISLVTPNYAGNVSDNERDVMLEVVQ